MLEIDLIEVIIGALLGLLLPYVPSLIIFINRKLKRSSLEGEWFVYHPTWKNRQFEIQGSMWDIGRSFFHPFSITEKRYVDKNNFLLYAKGFIDKKERNHLLIQLNTIEHNETVFMRINDPISTENVIISGIYLGLDFSGKIASGPFLISRKELSEQAIVEKISSYFGFDPSLSFIKSSE